MAVSRDGTKMMAAVNGGRVYSHNGSSWAEETVISAANYTWFPVGLDSTGALMAAAVSGGRLYHKVTAAESSVKAVNQLSRSSINKVNSTSMSGIKKINGVSHQ